MKNSIVKLGVLSAFLFMFSCGNAQQNEKGGKMHSEHLILQYYFSFLII